MHLDVKNLRRIHVQRPYCRVTITSGGWRGIQIRHLFPHEAVSHSHLWSNHFFSMGFAARPSSRTATLSRCSDAGISPGRVSPFLSDECCPNLLLKHRSPHRTSAKRCLLPTNPLQFEWRSALWSECSAPGATRIFRSVRGHFLRRVEA